MSQVECASAEMPRYKSHKTVWALKIAKIEQSPADELATVDGGTWRLIPEDKRYGPITVPHSYVQKHQPYAGGYYVVYADGYKSFSPAEAFEDGYIALGELGTGTKAETSIEAEIQAVGANVAPRITPDDIEAEITDEVYFTAAQGANGELATRGDLRRVEQGPLSLLTFCVLVLRNGFTVYGASGVASPENFNAEIGRKVARQKAMDEIGPLLGYELRSRLAANSMDFRDRVHAEKQDLDEKIARLSEFIASDKYTTLSPIQMADLHSQRVAMNLYSDVLAKRIAGFANT